MERGLQRGALAVGMGINYTAAATHDEILESVSNCGGGKCFGARPSALQRD